MAADGQAGVDEMAGGQSPDHGMTSQPVQPRAHGASALRAVRVAPEEARLDTRPEIGNVEIRPNVHWLGSDGGCSKARRAPFGKTSAGYFRFGSGLSTSCPAATR